MSRANDDAAEALTRAAAETPGLTLSATATERVRADARMIRRLLSSLNTKGMVTAQRLQVDDAREAIERIESEIRWNSRPYVAPGPAGAERDPPGTNGNGAGGRLPAGQSPAPNGTVAGRKPA